MGIAVNETPSQSCRMSLAIYDHSVTCHPTQVNTPRLNLNQTGQYSIYPYHGGMEGRVDLGNQLQDGLPAHRRSPIQVLTQQCTAGSWIHNLLITSPTP